MTNTTGNADLNLQQLRSAIADLYKYQRYKHDTYDDGNLNYCPFLYKGGFEKTRPYDIYIYLAALPRKPFCYLDNTWTCL